MILVSPEEALLQTSQITKNASLARKTGQDNIQNLSGVTFPYHVEVSPVGVTGRELEMSDVRSKGRWEGEPGQCLQNLQGRLQEAPLGHKDGRARRGTWVGGNLSSTSSARADRTLNNGAKHGGARMCSKCKQNFTARLHM